VQVNASTLGRRLSEFKEFLNGGQQKFSLGVHGKAHACGLCSTPACQEASVVNAAMNARVPGLGRGRQNMCFA
jgi:predicted PP-loop superfamily ATPase